MPVAAVRSTFSSTPPRPALRLVQGGPRATGDRDAAVQRARAARRHIERASQDRFAHLRRGHD